MRLFLIRHPRPDVPAGICYGRSDVGLAAPVDAEARRLAGLLPSGCAFVSSPLRRARLLAEALGPTRLEPRLSEMDFGDWELRPFDALRDELDAWAADPLGFRPPGGESAAQMAERARAAAAELLDHGATVAIVAHGGPLRAIAGDLLGLPAARWLALDFDFAALTELRVEPWGTTLRAFNR
ncbi:MAG: alpha-ribazole phosphatase family protein [Rhodocyclaceae bacterium]|nr:alpha-ribazole phosphatase family protein [Rhodocyclaceae bacterium]